jgi:transcriptional regulator with XRE-family HTH domain
MLTLGERVADARKEKGWSQSELAERIRRLNRALKTKQSTIQSLESGDVERPRFLRELGIALDLSEKWLLTGQGPRARESEATRTIPVMGTVGAGAYVELYQEPEMQETIDLPGSKNLGALQVVGVSMHPRFYPGEFVLYNLGPVPPATLLNQYAVVQTVDGERMIKILREGRAPSLFTLDSHNLLSIKDVQLLCAYKVVGVITDQELLLPEKRKRR